jgi:hypothetical protein
MPGGWNYPQPLSSGQTHKITAFSFEQLLKDMLDFRMRHLDLCGGAENATIERVRADLKKYICVHFRQNCGDYSGPPYANSRGGIGVSNYVTPINRATNWLAAVANERNSYVDPALAAQRAQVCAQCPANIHWATPCGPCNQNVDVRTQQLKGSMATPYDRNLFVCRAYGHMNSVAVWLADTHSTPEHAPPSHCWRLTEHG